MASQPGTYEKGIRMNLDTEFTQYIGTALWSSTVETSEEGDHEPMDRDHDSDDLAAETLDAMRAEFSDFLSACDPASLEFWEAEHGSGQVGHDFWLTRNGHGAGFWDRWSGGTRGYEHGRHLTAIAKTFGTSDLYIGDDGQIYVS